MKNIIQLSLSITVVVVCLIMLLVGSDFWHETVRRDVWNTLGAPFNDLWRVLFCFYSLFILLITSLGLDIITLFKSKNA